MRKSIVICLICVLVIVALSVDDPVSARAPETRQSVLDWLTAQQNNCAVVSGQQIGHGTLTDDGYQNLVVDLEAQTGRWVGFVEADYYDWNGSQNFTAFNQPLIEHWDRGGLVGVSWHAPNPWTGGTSWDVGSADLNDLLNPASPTRATWMSMLDGVATGLAHLRDNGVIVLWRPLHEMNGDWFWWGTSAHPTNPVPYRMLWQEMYDYFTNTKGLDNLIWVYSTAQEFPWTQTVDFYYPGGNYVDIVGQDIYDDDLDPVSYTALRNLGKPFAITEFGPNPTQDGSYDYLTMLNKVLNDYPETIYWLSWHDWYDNGDLVHISIIENQNATALMQHNCVTTVDEINIDPPSADVVQVPKTATAPTIDGQIDSMWSQAPVYSAENLLLGSPPTESDLAVSFRALYDNNNLYILVEESDESGQNDSGSSWWHDDSTEIYLDGDQSAGTSYDGVNDYHFGFRWQDGTAHTGGNSLPVPPGVDFAFVGTATGCRQEYKIPLSALDIMPVDGWEFGFDLHVNDDDNGGNRDNKVSWHATVDDVWFNPSLMGTAQLVESTPTAVQLHLPIIVREQTTAIVAATGVMMGVTGVVFGRFDKLWMNRKLIR